METKKCYYCWDDATTIDHIVPVSYYYSWKRKSLHLTSTYWKNNLIDCCRECNSIAGNKVFDDIEEKKLYIQDRIRNKYKKLINMPNWTDDEINELTWTLKKEIKIQVLARKWILNRVNYPVELFNNSLLNRDIKKFLEKEF